MNTEIWKPPLLLERWSEGGFLLAVFGRVLDGLSGLAGIFIKYIYAGCGKIQRLYFSTPVYRKFEKPVPTPTTRQAFRCRFMLLCWFNVCKSGKYGFSSILPYYCLKSLFEGIFTHFFVLVLHLFAFAYLCEKTHLRFDSNALVF